MKILLGNIFDSKTDVLVNTVNCVGVMGKGIALEFKKRFPQMFEEYVIMCQEGQIRPGKPYFYTDLLGNAVLNFPTKDNWRSPSTISYIRDGLQWFRDNYISLGIKSIAFPPLGCGNGGLEWDTVGPLMYQYLHDLPIDIEIYAPYGTPLEKLSEAFLKIPPALTFGKEGQVFKLNDRWLLILEAVREINEGRYTLHVGRVILQKICYVLTRLGLRTGFVFTKASYGPYSPEVKQAITVLSNSNLMVERQTHRGKMVETCVSADFKIDRNRYSDEELKWLEQTVDLFCRMKNTDQVEMTATILFAYDQLVGVEPVSENAIYEYVIEWKKRWKGTKDDEIKRTTRNLAMLNWISPTPSFILDDEY